MTTRATTADGTDSIGDRGAENVALGERWKRFCRQVEWDGLRSTTTREVHDELFPERSAVEIAAPALYEALKELADAVGFRDGTEDLAIDKARNALSLARGEKK